FHPRLAIEPIVRSKRNAKPLAVFLTPQAERSLALLAERGIAAFRTPEACADALAAYFAWRSPRTRGAAAFAEWPRDLPRRGRRARGNLPGLCAAPRAGERGGGRGDDRGSEGPRDAARLPRAAAGRCTRARAGGRCALAPCPHRRPAGRRGRDQSADGETRGRRRGRRTRRDEGARPFPSSLSRGAAEGGGVVRWRKSNHPGVLRTPPLLVQGGETHEGRPWISVSRPSRNSSA